ncbi:MAG TPA: ABC transporter substrate-binding protein [Planctomycetota bacterium]|nr:ABC transporter substrate-binding protein [Planctomycetota bacterium]
MSTSRFLQGGVSFFLASLILLLCGCGGGAKPNTQADGGKPADAPAAGGDTLARIKSTKVIKWGADKEGGAPFVYVDKTDKVVGFESEIMEKLAAHMGVKPELVSTTWDGLLDNMVAKRTDMVMNGIEVNEERAKVVSFSAPYYLYEQQLTVRAEDKDKYKTLEDLKGKKIGTLNGAEANNVLTKAGFTQDQIVGHADSLTPYDNLLVKRVDAVLQESIIAAHYAASNPKLFNVPQTFSPGKYAVAVRKEDKALLEEVNRILDVMKENGELAEIYKKWNIMNDKQQEVGIKEKK